jgi:phosphoribosylformimino-5-aminoimidazole carboxamide ribotide isomerase
MTWGNKKIVLAADTINDCLKINGWKQKTKINIFDHINYFQSKGLLNVKVTDVTRDGSLKGPPIRMYKKIIKKFPNLILTVGGGIRSLNDLYKLKELGIQNAIFGKAFYEGNISFDDVKNYIKN